MRKKEFVCDICGRTVNETREELARPLSVQTFCYSQNPLGPLCGNHQEAHLKYGEACGNCQKELSQTVHDKIQAMMLGHVELKLDKKEG